MKKHYRFAEDFFERGGIYGRSMNYPWRAGRIERRFRTHIHLTLTDLRRNSENSRAFNRQKMHPMFAYEWRIERWGSKPPKAREPLPLMPPVMNDDAPMWQEAA